MISKKTLSLRTLFFLISLAILPVNAMGMDAQHSPQKKSPLKEQNTINPRESRLDILCDIALAPNSKKSPVKRALDLDDDEESVTKDSVEKPLSAPTQQTQIKPILKKRKTIALFPENSADLAKKKIKIVDPQPPLETPQYEPIVRLDALRYKPFLPHKTYKCKWPHCTEKFKEAEFFNHLCKHICTIGTERKQGLKDDREMNAIMDNHFYQIEDICPWIECPMCTTRCNPNRTKQHFSWTLSLQQFLPLESPVWNFTTNNIQHLINHIFQDHYFNISLNNRDLKRITTLTDQINWHCIATQCQGYSNESSANFNTPCPRNARKVFTNFWELYWHLRNVVFSNNYDLRRMLPGLNPELWRCPFCKADDLSDKSLDHSQIMDHIFTTHYNFPDTCPLCLEADNAEHADAFTPLHIQRFHSDSIKNLSEVSTIKLFKCPKCNDLIPLNNTPAIFVHYTNCCLEKINKNAERIISIKFQFGSIQKQKNPLHKQYVMTNNINSRLKEIYEEELTPSIPLLNHRWNS